MTDARIEVTQEIIDSAIKRSSSNCAVKVALETRFPYAKRILVDMQTIRFTDDRTAGLGEWYRYWYLTPTKIQQYIVDWDAGKPIKPFSFTLKQPTKVTIQKEKVNTKEPSKIVLNGDISKRESVTLARVETKKRRLPPVAGVSNRRTYGLRGLTY